MSALTIAHTRGSRVCRLSVRTSVSPSIPSVFARRSRRRSQNRRGIDNVAFDSFALQNAVDPKPSNPASWMAMMGKSLPSALALLLELCSTARASPPHRRPRSSASTSSPRRWRQRCDQPGRSAEFKDAKIAGRSVWIAVDASVRSAATCMVVSKWSGLATSLCRARRSLSRRPWDLSLGKSRPRIGPV